MNVGAIIEFINLFCIGILAGEEFIIRYGVRAPLASLADVPHIEFRQALIFRMRIVVPIIFGLAILSGIVATLLNLSESSLALGFRCAGLLALLTFITVTLTGTVPINEAAITWSPTNPPSNWRSLIRRWEQLDTVRCWLALGAFMLFLLACAVQ